MLYSSVVHNFKWIEIVISLLDLPLTVQLKANA